jgi:CheY-like chemotaxis protein
MSKLLLVEDDNNLREIYEARLQAEGYTIVTAKDGEEALVVAKAERPDLIISDIMMPKISGFEMLDILRNTENLKTVPVIMLTALGQNDDQQRADKLGADRYLVKSQVTLEDIVKVAHELLGDEPAAEEPEATTPSPVETVATASTPSAPQPAPAPEVVATPPAASPEVAPIPASATPATTPVDEAVATPPADTLPPAPVPAPAPETPPAPEVVATPPAASPEVAPIPVSEGAASVEKAPVQTIAQEGAAVEARIEDFVTGATEEATPPPEAAIPAVDSATESSPKSDEKPKPNEAATTNEPAVDKEAVEQAVQSIEVKSESEPAAAPAAEPAAALAAEEDSAPPPSSAEAPSATPVSSTTSAVVHDKVITPLEADPKKDINTLLALEAVKEAGNKPAGPEAGKAVIVTDAQAPAAPAPAASPAATALGANPAPNSIIAPVGNGEDAPAITQSASAVTPPPAAQDPGADLNGIAI